MREIDEDKLKLRAMGYSPDDVAQLEAGVAQIAGSTVYSFYNTWPATMAYASTYGNVDKTLKRVQIDVAYSDDLRKSGQNQRGALHRAPVELIGLMPALSGPELFETEDAWKARFLKLSDTTGE